VRRLNQFHVSTGGIHISPDGVVGDHSRLFRLSWSCSASHAKARRGDPGSRAALYKRADQLKETLPQLVGLPCRRCLGDHGFHVDRTIPSFGIATYRETARCDLLFLVGDPIGTSVKREVRGHARDHDMIKQWKRQAKRETVLPVDAHGLTLKRPRLGDAQNVARRQARKA
jgi:hypothetical protein